MSGVLMLMLTLNLQSHWNPPSIYGKPRSIQCYKPHIATRSCSTGCPGCNASPRLDHYHDSDTPAGTVVAETPIARIQKIKRRSLILLALLLLLSTTSRWYRSSSSRSANYIPSSPSNAASAKRNSFLPSFSRRQKTFHPIRPQNRIRPASAKPLRLRAPPSRETILRNFVQARTSSFEPSDFSRIDTAIPVEGAEASASVPVLSHQLVTAVIVHDPDWHIENTQLVINLASRYPFIREVLVWNNDIDLQIDGQVSIMSMLLTALQGTDTVLCSPHSHCLYQKPQI